MKQGLIPRKYNIVVLTRDRLPLLRACLDSITRCSQGEDAQIIVVDNASADGTPAYLHDIACPNITAVCLTKGYGVWARNLGFELAYGEYVVQVDDDVRITSPEWLKIIEAWFVNVPDVGAVGQQGVYRDSTWNGIGNVAAPVGEFCDYLTGFAWAFKNEGWQYDNYWRYERSRWHEESFMQLQMRAAGYRFGVCKPFAVHSSAAGPVDWVQHNEALDYVRRMWKHREGELNFEPR